MKTSSILGYISKHMASRLREVATSLCFCTVLAYPVQERHFYAGPARGHQDDLGDWETSHGNGGWDWGSALGREASRGAVCCAHSIVSVTALCQVRRRGSQTSLRRAGAVQEAADMNSDRRFNAVQGKWILKARVVQYWERLPKEVMESFSLVLFKTWLDMGPNNLLVLTLFGAGVWTRWPAGVPSSYDYSTWAYTSV